MALDMKRLMQIMGMTGSDADGEALNAVRKANEMLRASNLTWTDVLRAPSSTGFGAPAFQDFRTPPSRRGTAQYGKPHRPTPRRQDEERVKSDDIETMLSELGAQRHDVSTLMFVASLREFWEREGYLTQSQYDHVKRVYDNGRAPKGQSSSGRWRF
jgi:hypothetical protein